jgi:hypothetical protein
LGLLVSPDEMADILTIIAELTAFNLAFHPTVLLLSQRNSFPVHAHSWCS